MQIKTHLFLCGLISLPLSASISLSELYRSAINSSEVIKISDEKVIQSQEQLSTAYSALQPKLNLVANYTEQDPPEVSAGRSQVNNSHFVKMQTTMPLYQGGKEYEQLSQSQNAILNLKEKRKWSESLLAEDLVSNYFLLQSEQRLTSSIKKEEQILSDRIGEIKQRVNVGKANRSDLYSANSALASVFVSTEQNQLQLTLYKKNLMQLSKLQIEGKVPEIPTPNVNLAPLSTYLEKLTERPDIKALELDNQSADHNYIKQKDDHKPTVDLLGNYYLERSGTPRPSNWDVGVTITLPLFKGGATVAAINESISKKRETRFLYEQTLLNETKKISDLYEALLHGKLQLAHYEKAIKSATDAYNEIMKQYRFSQSTMLEVLQAQTLLLTLERSLIKAESDLTKNWYILNLRTGKSLETL